jgi:hypothetical protein
LSPSTRARRRPQSKAVSLFSRPKTAYKGNGQGKALATGKPYKPGENEKVDLDKGR